MLFFHKVLAVVHRWAVGNLYDRFPVGLHFNFSFLLRGFSDHFFFFFVIDSHPARCRIENYCGTVLQGVRFKSEWSMYTVPLCP